MYYSPRLIPNAIPVGACAEVLKLGTVPPAPTTANTKFPTEQAAVTVELDAVPLELETGVVEIRLEADQTQISVSRKATDCEDITLIVSLPVTVAVPA